MLLFRRLGQRHLLGRAMISQGYVRICAGDSAQAVELLRQGLALADPGHEPRLVLAAQHCLAYLLHEGGRQEEARLLLLRNRHLYLEHGRSPGPYPAALSGGRDHCDTGETGASRPPSPRRGASCAASGMPLDATPAPWPSPPSSGQGRAARSTPGREMIAILGSLEVSREAMAALILFCRAAEARDVIAALVQEVTAQLPQTRRTV